MGSRSGLYGFDTHTNGRTLRPEPCLCHHNIGLTQLGWLYELIVISTDLLSVVNF